jgi:hypothetical protein
MNANWLAGIIRIRMAISFVAGLRGLPKCGVFWVEQLLNRPGRMLVRDTRAGM